MLRRWISIGALVLVPVFVCCVVVGCGEETGPQRRKGTGPSTRGDSGPTPIGEPVTELASTGWGKITGKITYDGTPPTPMILPSMLKDYKDKNVCLAGTMREKQDQTWIVGSDGGVANAVIWLDPPDNKYFKIRDDLKKPANVTIHQPHCAFIAHVVALFPKYQDKTGLRSTGQKLEVVNDSTIGHNFKFKDKNPNIPAGKSEFFNLPLDDEPVRAECSIHGWMSAYIWTFDHPYFAVTKDDGTFEIVVPAGVEVSVRGWHEARKDWGTLKKIKVKDGETLDLGSISLK